MQIHLEGARTSFRFYQLNLEVIDKPCAYSFTVISDYLETPLYTSHATFVQVFQTT